MKGKGKGKGGSWGCKCGCPSLGHHRARYAAKNPQGGTSKRKRIESESKNKNASIQRQIDACNSELKAFSPKLVYGHLFNKEKHETQQALLMKKDLLEKEMREAEEADALAKKVKTKAKARERVLGIINS